MRYKVARDDFVFTKTERIGQPDTRFWPVCKDYELRKLPPEATDGNVFDPYYLVSRYTRDQLYKWPHLEDAVELYSPLRDKPDLFLRFARLYDGGYSLDCILDWVHTYGLLGLQEGLQEDNRRYGGPEETVGRFWGEVEEAAGVLAMYEAVLSGDARAAKRLALEDFPSLGAPELRCDWPPLTTEERHDTISEIAARVESDPTDGGFGGDYLAYALSAAAHRVEWQLDDTCRPRLEMNFLMEQGSLLRWSNTAAGLVADWEFDNLLTAMYLQMYWLMGAGGDVTRCRQCNRIISLASPGTGMRKPPNHKKYCNVACRRRYHYYNKTKPRRQSNRS